MAKYARSIWIALSLVIVLAVAVVAGVVVTGLTQNPAESQTETTAPALDLASAASEAMPPLPSEQRAIAIYKKASPAVVNITSVTVTMDMFMNAYPQEGAGSGVILNSDGYILTNAHVVANANKLAVTLTDGRTYDAKLVGGTKSKDMALIKINLEPDDKPLTPIQLGDSSNLQVGQTVYAIGNPFGFYSTFTNGIISSTGRSLTTPNGRIMENVIQTDAAINPGNSGGALLDSSGRLIGINTAIFNPSRQGQNVGIGFALPINALKRLANDLISTGKIIRPYLGIQIGYEMSPELAKLVGAPVKTGLVITKVVEGSPAQKAGLQPAETMLRRGNLMIPTGGDIVVSYDGKIANSAEAFVDYIESKRPGETVNVKVIRNGQALTLNLVLAASQAE